MYPYIHIFGYEMSSYFLMALIGCAVSLVFILVRCPKRGLHLDDSLFFFALVLIGAIVGAKVLYLLVSIPEIYAQREILFSSASNALSLLSSGFVFYGGLIGGFIGAVCYAHIFQVNAVRTAENFIPAIPLFHFFGRIGCFLAGCCYGIPYSGPLAVTFTEALSDANGISRFPVQLLEAAFNLVLFFVLIIYDRISLKKERKKPLRNFALYLIIYGTARFFIEFLRGDAARGFWGALSTSQWISMAVIAFGIYIYACPAEKDPVVTKFFCGVLPNESPIPKKKTQS